MVLSGFILWNQYFTIRKEMLWPNLQYFTLNRTHLSKSLAWDIAGHLKCREDDEALNKGNA